MIHPGADASLGPRRAGPVASPRGACSTTAATSRQRGAAAHPPHHALLPARPHRGADRRQPATATGATTCTWRCGSPRTARPRTRSAFDDCRTCRADLPRSAPKPRARLGLLRSHHRRRRRCSSDDRAAHRRRHRHRCRARSAPARAHHLARAGQRVVVVEAFDGPAEGSTGRSFASIRGQWADPLNIELSWRSIQAYRDFPADARHRRRLPAHRLPAAGVRTPAWAGPAARPSSCSASTACPSRSSTSRRARDHAVRARRARRRDLGPGRRRGRPAPRDASRYLDLARGAGAQVCFRHPVAAIDADERRRLDGGGRRAAVTRAVRGERGRRLGRRASPRWPGSTCRWCTRGATSTPPRRRARRPACR